MSHISLKNEQEFPSTLKYKYYVLAKHFPEAFRLKFKPQKEYWENASSDNILSASQLTMTVSNIGTISRNEQSSANQTVCDLIDNFERKDQEVQPMMKKLKHSEVKDSDYSSKSLYLKNASKSSVYSRSEYEKQMAEKKQAGKKEQNKKSLLLSSDEEAEDNRTNLYSRTAQSKDTNNQARIESNGQSSSTSQKKEKKSQNNDILGPLKQELESKLPKQNSELLIQKKEIEMGEKNWQSSLDIGQHDLKDGQTSEEFKRGSILGGEEQEECEHDEKDKSEEDVELSGLDQQKNKQQSIDGMKVIRKESEGIPTQVQNQGGKTRIQESEKEGRKSASYLGGLFPNSLMEDKRPKKSNSEQEDQLSESSLEEENEEQVDKKTTVDVKQLFRNDQILMEADNMSNSFPNQLSHEQEQNKSSSFYQNQNQIQDSKESESISYFINSVAQQEASSFREEPSLERVVESTNSQNTYQPSKPANQDQTPPLKVLPTGSKDLVQKFNKEYSQFAGKEWLPQEPQTKARENNQIVDLLLKKMKTYDEELSKSNKQLSLLYSLRQRDVKKVSQLEEKNNELNSKVTSLMFQQEKMEEETALRKKANEKQVQELNGKVLNLQAKLQSQRQQFQSQIRRLSLQISDHKEDSREVMSRSQEQLLGLSKIQEQMQQKLQKDLQILLASNHMQSEKIQNLTNQVMDLGNNLFEKGEKGRDN